MDVATLNQSLVYDSRYIRCIYKAESVCKSGGLNQPVVRQGSHQVYI